MSFQYSGWWNGETVSSSFVAFSSMMVSQGKVLMRLSYKLKTSFFFHEAPLFLVGEEDWLWANICAKLPLFWMWDSATTWLDELYVDLCPGSEHANPWPPKWSGELNHYTTWPAPFSHIFCKCNYTRERVWIKTPWKEAVWYSTRETLPHPASLFPLSALALDTWAACQGVTSWAKQKEAQMKWSEKFQTPLELKYLPLPYHRPEFLTNCNVLSLRVCHWKGWGWWSWCVLWWWLLAWLWTGAHLSQAGQQAHPHQAPPQSAGVCLHRVPQCEFDPGTSCGHLAGPVLLPEVEHLCVQKSSTTTPPRPFSWPSASVAP